MILKRWLATGGLLSAAALALLLIPTTSAAAPRGGGGRSYGGGNYYGGGRNYGGSGFGITIGTPGYGGYNRGYYGSYPGTYGGYNSGYYGYPRNSGYFRTYPDYSGYYSDDTSQPQYYSSSGPANTYQSFYPPAAAESNNSVTVNVHVPDPNADVWFENTQTRQRGMDRSFVSPPMEPGHTYSYSIRARWTENGQPKDETRSVTVRPGERVTVDFTKPQGAETIPTAPDAAR